MVWGTLRGQTDETIHVMAHRDGFFDAAGDNASGVASMILLAKHYSGIPQSERPRTMIFIGLNGHHNSGSGFGVGRMWLAANHEILFDKTALLINAEHPSTIQTIIRPRYLNRDDEVIWSNSYTAFPLVCRRLYTTRTQSGCPRCVQGIRYQYLSRTKSPGPCRGSESSVSVRSRAHDNRLFSLFSQ